MVVTTNPQIYALFYCLIDLVMLQLTCLQKMIIECACIYLFVVFTIYIVKENADNVHEIIRTPE